MGPFQKDLELYLFGVILYNYLFKAVILLFTFFTHKKSYKNQDLPCKGEVSSFNTLNLVAFQKSYPKALGIKILAAEIFVQFVLRLECLSYLFLWSGYG